MQQDTEWPDTWTALPFSCNLAPTLLSGMSFRWRRVTSHGDCYVGVLGTTIVELRQDRDHAVSFRCANGVHAADVASHLLHAHLRLDDEATSVSSSWHSSGGSSVDATPSAAMRRYRECVRALPFVRVLSILDPWECLVSFLGSANNNIKRCMQMCEALARAFPRNRIGLDAYGEAHYAWPRVEEVAALDEGALWDLGWGYRAPRLYKMAREVIGLGGEGWLHGVVREAHVDVASARSALTGLTGVGRKVADCVLLFGAGCDAVVPVDTHCYQLAQVAASRCSCARAPDRCVRLTVPRASRRGSALLAARARGQAVAHARRVRACRADVARGVWPHAPGPRLHGHVRRRAERLQAGAVVRRRAHGAEGAGGQCSRAEAAPGRDAAPRGARAARG